MSKKRKLCTLCGYSEISCKCGEPKKEKDPNGWRNSTEGPPPWKSPKRQKSPYEYKTEMIQMIDSWIAMLEKAKEDL